MIPPEQIDHLDWVKVLIPTKEDSYHLLQRGESVNIVIYTGPKEVKLLLYLIGERRGQLP